MNVVGPFFVGGKVVPLLMVVLRAILAIFGISEGLSLCLEVLEGRATIATNVRW